MQYKNQTIVDGNSICNITCITICTRSLSYVSKNRIFTNFTDNCIRRTENSFGICSFLEN